MINSLKLLCRVVVAMAFACVLGLVGCDYQKQIDDLKEKVDNLAQLTNTLNEKVGNNLLVKSVAAVGTNGWDITFSDNTTVQVRGAEAGADGITPKLKVAANGEDGFSVWYNVTEGYPESGWVNTGENIQGPQGADGVGSTFDAFELRVEEGVFQYTLDGETWIDLEEVPVGGGIITGVSENPDGTVTFVTEDGPFTFAQVDSGTTPAVAVNSIVVLDQVATIGAGNSPVDAIKFRVSPSTADVLAYGLDKWTLDAFEGLTRASFLNPSERFEIVSIAEDGAQGQYIAKVQGLVGADLATEDLMLVLNAGTTAAPVLISSGTFQITLAAGELAPSAADALLEYLAEGLNDDGYANNGDPYNIKFTPSQAWTATVTSGGVTRAYNDGATWVTLTPDNGTSSPSAVTVGIELEENSDIGAKARSATVTIATENASLSFDINQEAAVDLMIEGGFTANMKTILGELLGDEGGLEVLDDYNRLSKDAAANVPVLDFGGYDLTGAEIESLAEFFTGVTTITLPKAEDAEELGEVDLSGFEALEELDVNGTSATSLILPEELAMTELIITDNEELTSITMPEESALTDLTITGNEKLASLDLSAATALVEVDLSGNALTEIKLPAEADNLTTLDVSNNKLTSLDVSNLPAGISLTVEGNPGLPISSTTRVDITHQFVIKVWKGFNVEQTEGLPENGSTWTYTPAGSPGYAVKVVYDVPPTNYPTSIVISTDDEDITLSGSAGAWTLSIDTAVETVTFEATLNEGVDEIASAVVWNTDKPAIADVDEDGVVTIKGAGVAVIEAIAQGEKGEISDKVTITVNPKTLSTLTLSLPEGVDASKILALGKDQTVQLTPNINADATLKTVEWSVSGSENITVSETGLVTVKAAAIATNTATVTAKIVNGRGIGSDATATVNFTVVAFTPVTAMTVEAYKEAAFTNKIANLDAFEAGSLQTVYLKAEITDPESGSTFGVSDIEWSMKSGSNENFTVSSDGVVTIAAAAAAGNTATVVATIKGGAAEGENFVKETELEIKAGA